jgi:cytoskeletal protein CcmA (bactofilin family)
MIAVRARLALALWAVSLASVVGCVRPKPESQMMRLGNDILISGSAPNFQYDSVPGDAILAGGEIYFSATTAGDYVGAGGNQEIAGRVHGSLRAAGGNVKVKGSVDRNATVGGGNLVVDSTAVIGGNAYLIGGAIRVDGTVRQGVLAIGGGVILNGAIGGDVEIATDELHIGPHAQIAGNLRYKVPAKGVHIDKGARIAGKVTSVPVSKRPGLFGVLWTFGGLLAGLVIVLLIPRFVAEASDALQMRPVRSVIVGIAGLFVPAIAIVIAAVTVVGLPLALIATTVLFFLLSMSAIPVAVWIGEKILHGRTLLGRQSALVNYFLGALVLIIVRVIPVLGGLVFMIATCIGFGAILLAAWWVHQRQVA